jgi:hypothetical protein
MTMDIDETACGYTMFKEWEHIHGKDYPINNAFRYCFFGREGDMFELPSFSSLENFEEEIDDFFIDEELKRKRSDVIDEFISSLKKETRVTAFMLTSHEEESHCFILLPGIDSIEIVDSFISLRYKNYRRFDLDMFSEYLNRPTRKLFETLFDCHPIDEEDREERSISNFIRSVSFDIVYGSEL